MIVAAAALALPATASAATVTTNKDCYRPGESGTVRIGGFVPGATVDTLVDDQPMVNLIPNGSGVSSAPFTPLASPTTGEARETLIASSTSESPALTAKVTYLVSAIEVKMSPGSAKLTSTVTWKLSGFGSGAAFLHVARRNAVGKTVTVRTQRLGTLNGPCGSLTVRTKQLPLRKPAPGTTYVLRFNTRSSPNAAALVQRTVKTPPAPKVKAKPKTKAKKA